MNILDIKLDGSKIPWEWFKDPEGIVPDWEGTDIPADLLSTIFAGQRKLMEKYHGIETRNGCVTVEPEHRGEIDDRRVQMRIKDLAYRVVEELSEATNCLKNKPWKDSFVATDRDHFNEELADAFHFFVELLETAGIGPLELFLLYFRKHAVNQFRQRSGY